MSGVYPSAGGVRVPVYMLALTDTFQISSFESGTFKRFHKLFLQIQQIQQMMQCF